MLKTNLTSTLAFHCSSVLWSFCLCPCRNCRATTIFMLWLYLSSSHFLTNWIVTVLFVCFVFAYLSLFQWAWKYQFCCIHCYIPSAQNTARQIITFFYWINESINVSMWQWVTKRVGPSVRKGGQKGFFWIIQISPRLCLSSYNSARERIRNCRNDVQISIPKNKTKRPYYIGIPCTFLSRTPALKGAMTL